MPESSSLWTAFLVACLTIGPVAVGWYVLRARRQARALAAWCARYGLSPELHEDGSLSGYHGFVGGRALWVSTDGVVAVALAHALPAQVWCSTASGDVRVTAASGEHVRGRLDEPRTWRASLEPGVVTVVDDAARFARAWTPVLARVEFGASHAFRIGAPHRPALVVAFAPPLHNREAYVLVRHLDRLVSELDALGAQLEPTAQPWDGRARRGEDALAFDRHR